MECKIPKKKIILLPKKALVPLQKKPLFVPRKLADIDRDVAKRIIEIPIEQIGFPDDYRLDTVGITQSLFDSFHKCRRCFKLALNRYEPVDKRNITAFGSLCHHCLDKMYNYAKVNSGRVPEEYHIGGWIQEFSQQHPDEFHNMKIQDIEIIKLIAHIILTEYTIYYSDDFTSLKFEQIEKVSEVRFCNALLKRKVDGKYRVNNKKWLMEHKTKSQISLDTLLLQLTFDFQNLFYVTCEEVEFPGDPVEGVLYNIIRNPGTRPHVGETLQDFGERLKKEVKKNQKYYFLRYEIPYTEKDKRIFREELSIKLEEATHLIVGMLPEYRNQSACIGRFTCDYLPACSSGKLTGYEKRKFLFPELEA